MHLNSSPAILYFGTPVVLISTVNEDGSYNLAPMSSVFWLGWRCMIGLSMYSKTTQNILRTGECVLNLPSVKQVEAVNLLAKTTGVNPVPSAKFQRGYRYEKEKFDIAGLTPQPSETIMSPRVLECPVQLEAVVEGTHGLAQNDPALSGRIITIELRMQRVHLDESIIMDGNPNRVDPDKWRPLIMSFQEFYGLGEKVHYSTLGEIPESMYQTKDLERAQMMV
ncbi:NADH-FMN oxidoreductase RutF, flavin reductase (DIM6/NTAB) family [Chitinophaga sp. YR573]|uniref:flavin reductase family protein n=1 Tax=Chitinophaga sp. YR573 TaxID=1881040 RepID=UPI0008CD8EBC|nr:flavin reductase family protein [Chitinophaga sp. YR573]SEW39750.1 NADH-FMN oxidoreductase RutF, flavin reductase (DIM6/NTAB) family [Chitinophaga sp. YR573]